MNLVEFYDGKAIYEFESMYWLEKFVVSDINKYSEVEGKEWKLTRYEKESLSNHQMRFNIVYTYASNRSYSELIMTTLGNFLSRRIRFDKDGNVLCDYIVDSFNNPLKPIIYEAFGNYFDYSGKVVGSNLHDYLKSNHVFVNSSCSDDIYKNRWLDDKYFIEFLNADKYLAEQASYLKFDKPYILRKK